MWDYWKRSRWGSGCNYNWSSWWWRSFLQRRLRSEQILRRFIGLSRLVLLWFFFLSSHTKIVTPYALSYASMCGFMVSRVVGLCIWDVVSLDGLLLSFPAFLCVMARANILLPPNTIWLSTSVLTLLRNFSFIRHMCVLIHILKIYKKVGFKC